MFLELAISLFEKKKLTLGQASDLCSLSQYQFQHILSSRGINIHYDIEDFDKDVQTLKSLRLIWKLSQIPRQLKFEAGFRLSKKLYDYVLRTCGE